MTLEELFRGVPVLLLSGDPRTDITSLAYSSADVRPGGLFAALKGEVHDGIIYIGDALARGASAVLSDRPKPDGIGAAWVQVFDAREALALASANFYGHPSRRMTLVGITGTKGKTTMTYLLEAILRNAGFSVGVIGTINYRGPGFVREAKRTTPEAPDLQSMLAEMAEGGATHGIMEVSSHALDRKRVVGVAFDVAVFTNLSNEHLDYHLTMEDYFAAKKKIFFLNSKKRTAVVNQDDPWGQKLIAELPMTTVTYGLSPAALVWAERFKLNGAGIEALIKHPGGQIGITSTLSGRHNLYNILASFAVALALNVPPMTIRDGLALLTQVPGRFEKVANTLGFQVFIDFAHTEDSLRNILETARDLKPARLLVVFGAGGDRDRMKRAPMGRAASELADWVILTSDNPRSEDPQAILRDIEKGLLEAGKKSYAVVPDRREAIAKALGMARKGDLIVIAGKGHETYQEIKGRTEHFSDVETAREVLLSLGSK